MKWADLFKIGEVMRIKASHTSPCLGLTAKDLGVMSSAQAVVERIVNAKIRLFPRDFFSEINKAERDARDALEGVSMKMDITDGRFVPAPKIAEVEALLAGYAKTFRDEVNFAATQLELAIKTQAPVIQSAVAEIVKDPIAIAAVMGKVAKSYPTEEKFRADFNLRWTRYRLDDSEAASAITDAAKDVNDTLRGMVVDLRGRVTVKLETLKALASGGEKVNQRSINAALKALDEVESFNATLGDVALTSQIAALRSILSATQESGKIAAVVKVAEAALAEGIDVAVKAAEDRITGLGKRKLSLPDPSPVVVEATEPSTGAVKVECPDDGNPDGAKMAAAAGETFDGWNT